MTIELPDDLSERLTALAARWGQTPDEMAVWLLLDEVERIEANITDPDFKARAEALRAHMAEGARQVRDEHAAEQLAARILGDGGGAD